MAKVTTKKQENNKIEFGGLFEKYGIYFILLLLIVGCSILNKNFFTLKNIMNVMRQISVICIIAFAEMILMVGGDICLSAGSQLCCSGMLGLITYMSTGSMILSVLVSVMMGLILGMVNGVLTSYLGISAFITTLASNMIFRGFVNIATQGRSISPSDGFAVLGQGYIGFIPIPVIIMIVIVVIMWFILSRTVFGRRMLAIGGNYNAASASGVKVKRYRLFAFLVSGALCGLAGIVHLSRLNMGSPTAGEGYEMDAIAGAVIGGTSMQGGSASAVGVLVGSMIIGVINNILNLMDVMSYTQDVIKGFIIIAAILLDIQTKKKYL